MSIHIIYKSTNSNKWNYVSFEEKEFLDMTNDQDRIVYEILTGEEVKRLFDVDDVDELREIYPSLADLVQQFGFGADQNYYRPFSENEDEAIWTIEPFDPVDEALDWYLSPVNEVADGWSFKSDEEALDAVYSIDWERWGAEDARDKLFDAVDWLIEYDIREFKSSLMGLGLTQKEFGELAGISNGALYRSLNGKKRLPKSYWLIIDGIKLRQAKENGLMNHLVKTGFQGLSSL